jgi:broad specificity phosphatase PhoE
MAKIILIRHGQTAGNAAERFRGRLELALSAEGRHQAELTAKRIKAMWRPAAIYTSPMSRCISTGSAIAVLCGLEVQPEAGLLDIDYGNWQGLTHEEARARWAKEIDIWFRAPHLAAIPGGENLQRVLARVVGALHGILLRHADDIVVLVGHDSVNRVVLMHALDLPMSRYWRFKQDHCAVNELDFENDLFTVRTINETWHLRPER